jgi:hypothetical protein
MPTDWGFILHFHRTAVTATVRPTVSTKANVAMGSTTSRRVDHPTSRVQHDEFVR